MAGLFVKIIEVKFSRIAPRGHMRSNRIVAYELAEPDYSHLKIAKIDVSLHM